MSSNTIETSAFRYLGTLRPRLFFWDVPFFSPKLQFGRNPSPPLVRFVQPIKSLHLIIASYSKSTPIPRPVNQLCRFYPARSSFRPALCLFYLLNFHSGR